MTAIDEQAPAVETADEWAEKIQKFTARRPHEQPVTFPDPDAQAALDVAMQALLDARRDARKRWQENDGEDSGPLDEYIEADEAVVAAQERAREAAVAADRAATTFLFRSLPPGAYDALGLQHPPTDEQLANRQVINTETYIPELISLCSAKPLTVEQVKSLIHPRVVDDEEIPPPLNAGEVGVLIAACRAVNEDTDLSLGKGWRPTLS